MNISISNAYDPLKAGIMVFPSNIALSDPIKRTNLDFTKILALEQFDSLVQILVDNHVKIHTLELVNSATQLFTRDIGFIINDIFFISKMTESMREQEINPLMAFVKYHGFKTHKMENNVEGGDIFVHDNKVILGIGGRTTDLAAKEINQVLLNCGSNYEIVEVRFDLSKIHLDCVFNVLDKNTCLLSGGIMEPKKIIELFPNVVNITTNELSNLGSNIINLGNKKILCSNEELTRKLTTLNYEATYVDYSEIVKTEGSLGCCLLPTQREA